MECWKAMNDSFEIIFVHFNFSSCHLQRILVFLQSSVRSRLVCRLRRRPSPLNCSIWNSAWPNSSSSAASMKWISFYGWLYPLMTKQPKCRSSNQLCYLRFPELLYHACLSNWWCSPDLWVSWDSFVYRPIRISTCFIFVFSIPHIFRSESPPQWSFTVMKIAWFVLRRLAGFIKYAICTLTICFTSFTNSL